MAYGRGFNFSKFTLICALNDRTWHGMEFMYLWGWRSDFYGWVGLWQAAKLDTTQHNTLLRNGMLLLPSMSNYMYLTKKENN